MRTHALLVILADDYGDPARGLSFEFETFVPAFRRHFDAVTVFPLDRELRERGYFGMQDALRTVAASTSPDVLFCVPFENQVDWNDIGAISGAGVTTVAWMCDDHWRWETFSRHIARHFTAIVTTDRDAFLKYHRSATTIPILSQWAVDVSRIRPVSAPRDIDVSFVGGCRPHRARIVAALRRSGVDVFVRGTGWPEGRASTQELVDIPARSRVSLNFADSTQGHEKGKTQLKARPFELAASGTCVVTEPDPQLDRFFSAATEMVVTEGTRGFVHAVKSLLGDESTRSARAHATWERAVGEHTYDIRLSRIFELLGVPAAVRASEGALCVTR